jgi:hypothetical protein
MRDAAAGFAYRHSPAAIASVARHWPSTRPLVSYARQWISASFYFQRDIVPFFDEQHSQDLVQYLGTQEKALVLVETGAPLQQFLGLLPGSLEPEIHYPTRQGQPALVLVHPRRPATASVSRAPARAAAGLME